MTTIRNHRRRGGKVLSMNKLILAGIAGLLVIAVHAQTTPTVRSRNAVGLVRVDIAGSNQLTLLAVPFLPVNAVRAYTLDEVLGTNLHAGATAATADEVFVWDGAQQTYHAAFLGDASLGGLWSFMGADNLPHPCTQTNLFDLVPTVGFFVRNTADARSLYFSGDTPLAANTTLGMTNIQLRGQPYPVKQQLSTLLTTSDGARANWSPLKADQVWLWNSAGNRFDEYFLADATWGDASLTGRWCSMGTDGLPHPATNTVIQVGQGYFYKAQGTGFSWQASKPFVAP